MQLPIKVKHTSLFHAGMVSGLRVSGWLLEFYLPRGTRAAWDFQPWRSMDKCVLPSGLAELEQLHVEPSSEHSTSLHHSSIHYRWWKAGWGLEKGLGYERVERSDLSVLEQLHVELNSEHGQHILHSHYFLVSVVCEEILWRYVFLFCCTATVYLGTGQAHSCDC